MKQITAARLTPMHHFLIVSEAKDPDAGRTEGGLYKPSSAAVEPSPFRRVTVLASGPGWRQQDGSYLPTLIEADTEALVIPNMGVMIYEDDEEQQFVVSAEHVIARVQPSN